MAEFVELKVLPAFNSPNPKPQFLIFAAQSEIQAETQAGPQHGIFIQAD